MKIYLIRHGLTAGNLEKRYIGRTDEPLCGKGISMLKQQRYSVCEKLICSPMKRCIQTAEIIFPEQEYMVSDELRECDFGSFEGMNHIDLNGDPYYQKWIDSGGMLTFPGGESPDAFRKRCCMEFNKITEKISGSASAAFVVHGGTIMSILEKFAVPHRGYYDFSCKNGHGYRCEWNGKILTVMEQI